MYEHPSHKADRQQRAVAPVLDLSGWQKPQADVPSAEGQQALPGLESVERDRAYRGRRDEGKGQQHLF